MEQLIMGKKKSGGYYVRPANWAGVWEGNMAVDAVLVNGNTLFESENKAECEQYIMNHKLLELVKENPSLPIVPLTYYEVLGGDTGYWLGHIKSVEIKEYAINEWEEESSIIFKDEDEERLIECIAENLFDGTDAGYEKAEKEAADRWVKAIVIRIGL